MQKVTYINSALKNNILAKSSEYKINISRPFFSRTHKTPTLCLRHVAASSWAREWIGVCNRRKRHAAKQVKVMSRSNSNSCNGK